MKFRLLCYRLSTTQALGDLDGIGLRVPQPRDGGFYLWAELPAGTDEAVLWRWAVAHSIFLAPEAVFRFSPGQASHVPAIRINVAHASKPWFLAFMKQALSETSGTRAPELHGVAAQGNWPFFNASKALWTTASKLAQDLRRRKPEAGHRMRATPTSQQPQRRASRRCLPDRNCRTGS